MKTTVVVSLLLLMVFAGLANAQEIRGQLQLYADDTGVDCMIPDTAPGLLTVYVYYFDYFGDDGISAIQFAAPKPDCFTNAVWLGDATPWPLSLGDSQLNDPHGWTIAFGAGGWCQTPPVYLGSIMYLAQGLTPTCCPYPVVKADDLHPEIPMPIGVDCSLPNSFLIGVEAGTSYINGDHTCPCIWPVPVQIKTWGGIKSLYR